MKKLISFLFILASLSAQAKNYYVSSSTGNDANAGTISAPFRTLNKVNTLALLTKDSVLFKRGDTFLGKLIVKSSGSSTGRIVYGAYGTGNKPILYGFAPVTWTSVGTNLYETVETIPVVVNLVVVGTALQKMGRFPNTGYLTINSYSGTTSITSSQLTSPTNWTGADVVIRKNRWILDVCKVTNQVSTTVSYTNPATGNIPTQVDNIYTPKTGYGFFFQNDARTLDTAGEWYYNPSTKKLRIYSTTSPTSVSVSSYDTIINCGSKTYITIENLDIEGGNEFGVFAKDGSNVTVSGCVIKYNKDAINFWNITNSNVKSNSITFSLNNGIQVRGRTSGGPTVIESNVVSNSGMLAGMGRSGDGYYIGIRTDGDNATIRYNNVNNSGYLGIQFGSTNQMVAYNTVSNFCSVKDDGGGIYTYQGSGKTNRTILSNTIINAIGAPEGTNNKSTELYVNARGIYLDGAAPNVNILNNTIVNCGGAGLYLSNSVNVRATGNIVFNAPQALSVQRFPTLPQVRSNVFTSNIFYPTKNNFLYWNGELNVPVVITIQNDLKAIARIDSNYYRTDLTDQFDWFYHLTDGGTFVDPPSMTLSQWKAYTLNDANAIAIPINTNTICQYNTTGSNASFGLSGTYKDVKTGVLYTNAVTIPPYSGMILQKQSAIVMKSSIMGNGYPNPAKDVFNVNVFSPAPQTGNVSVVDVSGRTVYNNKINLYRGGNTIKVDTSRMNTGTYSLALNVQNVSRIYKFVKN
jgi:parallel beta-helix repeat protein